MNTQKNEQLKFSNFSKFRSITFGLMLLTTLLAPSVTYSQSVTNPSAKHIERKMTGNYPHKPVAKDGYILTKDSPHQSSSLVGKLLASRKLPAKNSPITVPQKSENIADINNPSGDSATQVGDTMIMEKSRTNLDFSESLIEGKMKAPSGFYIQARKGQKLTNLIKLRASFRPEMLKSRGILVEQSNQ